MSVSLAFVNARLWNPPSTCKSAPSHVSDVTMATALGICGDKINVIGSNSEVLSTCQDDTVVIDAKQGLLLPGFTDCHVHFLDGGYRLLSVPLRKCKTRGEFVATLKEYIDKQPSGSWIIGGNWDHQQWGAILPDKTWIDDISGDHPVWLNRVDGHMYLANSIAMELAGVDENTPDLPGGTIVRFPDGKPTGIFKDNATNWIVKIIAPRTKEESCAALEAAMSYVAERGVTKVHTMITVDCHSGLWPADMGRDADKQDVELAFEEISLYKEFMKQDKLKTRIRAALPVASWKRVMRELLEIEDPILFKDLDLSADCSRTCSIASERKKRHQMFDSNEFLQVGVLKAQMDGSLGTHTAAFFEDYTDTPGDKGNFIWDPSILTEHVLNASCNNLDVCVHAIGDSANTATLDMFRDVSKHISELRSESNEKIGKVPDLDLRFRIEHAQHLRKSDIPRFGELNVIASMQMSHLADDGCWATTSIGEDRMKTSWPMRSLLDGGAVVALGSDWFVAEPSPLQSIYDAVTRRAADGNWQDGLVPEERVTVEEALIGFTCGAAYAAHEEERRGVLGVGMLADLVLLNENILEIPVDEVPNTRVMTTVVGGKVVYSDLGSN